jgi:hypothetical protein
MAGLPAAETGRASGAETDAERADVFDVTAEGAAMPAAAGAREALFLSETAQVLQTIWPLDSVISDSATEFMQTGQSFAPALAARVLGGLFSLALLDGSALPTREPMRDVDLDLFA